jgi:hypothetical protein
MTARSWMFVYPPIVIGLRSARTTAPYQMEVASLTITGGAVVGQSASQSVSSQTGRQKDRQTVSQSHCELRQRLPSPITDALGAMKTSSAISGFFSYRFMIERCRLTAGKARARVAAARARRVRAGHARRARATEPRASHADEPTRTARPVGVLPRRAQSVGAARTLIVEDRAVLRAEAEAVERLARLPEDAPRVEEGPS